MPKLFIIAGEESSDLHSANLIYELKKRSPELIIYGLGGEKMENAGAILLDNLVGHAVIGFWEVIKKYNYFRKIFYKTLDWIKNNRPDAVILVDYPGFNLRLAEQIHPLNIPIIYYISPQVWAWGKNRIYKIVQYISKMIVILPFEIETYSGTGLETEFIGHPLLDIIKIRENKSDLCKMENLNPSKPILSILPGSRLDEIKRHLPIILDAIKIMKQNNPEIQIILPLVNMDYYSLVKNIIQEKNITVTIVTENKYDWRAASDLSIVASGTATLESAIIGTPLIIIYKVSFVTCLFARWMIKLPYIGLVNVVAGKKIVPELLQYDLTATKLAKVTLELLADKTRLKSIQNELNMVKNKLGREGASARAAESILKFINR